MRCGRAVIIDKTIAIAVDKVVIVHEDSIYIFADSLVYNGKEKLATFYGEVIFLDGDRTLHTTKLIYDIKTKIGRYKEGGTLMDTHHTRLISKVGYYDVKAGKAMFKKNVEYRDTVRQLFTDSLVYNYNTNRLYIVKPTRILQDTIDLQCNFGVYDVGKDKAILSEGVAIRMGNRLITAGLLEYTGKSRKYAFYFNPKYQEGETVAIADTLTYQADSAYVELIGQASYVSNKEKVKAGKIVYHEEKGTYKTFGQSTAREPGRNLVANNIFKNEKGETVATGAVMMEDSTRGIIIWCDQFEVSDSTNKVKAYSHATKSIMAYRMDTAYFLIRADTLVSYSQTIDNEVIDYFDAYHNVEFAKSNMAGISDTLSFNTRDSAFILYSFSFVWSDSTQMSGDTIGIFLASNALDKVILRREAFVISRTRDGHYNQISGNRMESTFKRDKLDRSKVFGNTELVYYIKDEKGKYIGINKTKSSRMSFIFDQDEIKEVRLYKNPESNIFEYKGSEDVTSFNLPGFNWSIERKPVILIPKRK